MNRTRLTTRLAAIICASAILFTAGCRSDGDATSDEPAATSDEPAASNAAVPAETADSNGDPNQAASQGITDSEIRIGASIPLSGPLAFNDAIAGGAEAYFESVNASGGIDGRMISFNLLDDAYDPSRTASNARQLVERDEVFALMVYGGPAMAIRDYLEEKEVPQIAFAGNEPFNNTEAFGYSRSIWPDVRLEFGIATLQILEENPDAKIGIFGINNDFTISVVDGVELALKGEGKEDQLVAVERFEQNATDLSGQINKLRADGVDVLITTFGGPLSKAIEYTRQIGWEAPIYNYSNSTSKLTLIDILAPEATETGLRTVRWFNDPADPALADDPGMIHFREVIDEFGDGVSADDALTMNGYIAAEAVVAALRNMEAPTGSAFVEAWDTMPPTDSDGLVGDAQLEAKPGGRLVSSYVVTEWSDEGWKVIDGPIDGIEEGLLDK